MKLNVLITSKAEADLASLEMRNELIELMEEIENAPLLFFAHAELIDRETVKDLHEKHGNLYQFKFKSSVLIFLKADQSLDLYLIAVL